MAIAKDMGVLLERIAFLERAQPERRILVDPARVAGAAFLKEQVALHRSEILVKFVCIE